MTMTTVVSYAALEQFHVELSDMDDIEALEAFQFLTRLLDSFTRLINNIKTMLLHHQKVLKRSELKMLHDSHSRELVQLFTKAVLDENLVVPIPTGMKVTYLKAVTDLNTFYTSLQIEQTSAILLSYVQKIASSGSIPLQDDTLTKINRVTKDQTEKLINTLFSGTDGHTQLKNVFGSFSDILTVDKMILNYESVFQQVDLLSARLTTIDQTLDQIITKLERSDTVNKQLVNALYKIVRAAGIQFDMYGVVLSHMQIIEHNFVIVLRLLLEQSRH